MTDSLKNIYEGHHQKSRESGFSIMKAERGNLLRDLVGKGKDVLDIGCRDGALTQYFKDGNRVLGLDIDERALALAAKLGIETKIADLNGDWAEIGERKFDAVVAGEVLEHLYYPEKVIDKIFIRLKPGGLFVGSVPNAFSLKNRIRFFSGTKRHTPLADPTHINHFHINELEAMLKQRFLKVEMRGLGRHEAFSRWFPGLFSFDLFFVARK